MKKEKRASSIKTIFSCLFIYLFIEKIIFFYEYSWFLNKNFSYDLKIMRTHRAW